MPNRLAGSTSPYLLQHANNPVDWRPWGEEAFEEARRRGVPILLSIGYSTCYWCHVMERESFEDPAVGRFLSDRFVCIKVDREERPDVDDLYMQATLAVRGQGGWPLTAFLEPDHRRPFWCGTYLPPTGRPGLPSLTQVAQGVAEAWAQRRHEVAEQAAQVAAAVADQLRAIPDPLPLGREQPGEALSVLMRMYDRQHGGFGRAPKFPQPVFLDFLLDVRGHVDLETASAVDLALRHTLDRMAVGGLFDQVGGGFHRYSVDAHWTVPHFEKMLYDNAMLASVYARAAAAFGDPFYASIARRTTDAMLREMRVMPLADGPGAAFASALDAEVHHHEGQNYLWTLSELRAALPPEDAALAAEVYGVSRGPNFRDPHHPDEPAVSVLRLDDRPERLADPLGLTPAELAARLDAINARLYAARTTRPQPHRDDKVLAAWNGLMMSALAHVSRATGEPAYLEAGLRAASFITTELMPWGDLCRSWRDGRVSGPAFFEDYALVIRGLLDLAATGNPAAARLVPAAADLAGHARRHFRDPSGVYFDTRDHQPDLFVRARSLHDGALPSATGVHLHNLIDLAIAAGPRDGAAFAAEAGLLLASASGTLGRPGAAAGSINSIRALLRMLTDDRADELFTPVLATLAAAPAPPAEPREDAGPVEVYAGVERVEVGPGRPAVLELLVRIADGHHVIAAEPGEGWEGLLTPLRVLSLDASGESGPGESCIEAFADYPTGRDHGMDGQTVRVYEGSFTMKVVLEAEGPWRGKPLLAVEFQACSDTACQRPRRVELDVAIDRAP